jgi:cold shock CspA family protein
MNIDQLPIETGKIHTLLENFGFIYCAERASDLFFHYSEVTGCTVDDLNLEDEVQFHVGPSKRSNGAGSSEDEQQLSAYKVQVLPRGTVHWEIEDEPKGSRRKGKVEKMIRFNSRDSGSIPCGTIRMEDSSSEIDDGSKKSTLVRFTVDDYDGYKRGKNGGELELSDLVEFTLVTERRSGLKYARDIVLLQSERQRLEEEHEKRMLESATLEQGVVVSLKNGYGFLRSNKRREEVYFHFSHVVLPDETEEEHVLKDGQDMEFLVVDDGKKVSARQVKFLPEGTVIFEQPVSNNVMGTLTMMPNLSASSRRSNRELEKPGKVLLKDFITFESNGEMTDIHEVDIYPNDIQHLVRDENVWVKVGDVLVFDVVKDIVDGRFRASPTNSSENKGRIQLVSPCLAGRAEGRVVSLKENFGFIQLSHRNLDVYFRISDIFPVHIQKNFLDATTDEIEGVRVGSEVSFDLSISPPGSIGGGTKRYSKRGNNEKEQIRAQRLALLSSGATEIHKTFTSVSGIISKVENFNKYCGVVKLSEKIQGITISERYPLLKKLLDGFENESATALHFTDVQSEEENDIIVSATEEREGLEVTFTPDADFGDLNRGRIVIRKKTKVCDGTSDEKVDGMDAECPFPPEEEKEGMIEKEEKDDLQNCTTISKSEKKKKRSNVIQNLTYDRSSIVSHLADDPPKCGDKVQMNITYVRNSGRFTVTDLDVTERCSDNGGVVKYNLCEGYVLLEPRYTSLSLASNKNRRKGFSGNDDDRWGSSAADLENSNADDGLILLLKDPANIFEKKVKLPSLEEEKDEKIEATNIGSESVDTKETESILLQVPFTLASVGRGESNPKRGDMVSFVKGKGNKARDVKILQSGVAPRVKGKLTNINTATGTSMFIIGESGKCVDVKLSDVVGCDPTVLKDEVTVEGIEYEDLIVGICRFDDLYLARSVVGNGPKERPKLNLTVKKELQGLGGQIIAQSGMAKGPDGTIGFVQGWTSRQSPFVVTISDDDDQVDKDFCETVEALSIDHES